MPDVNQVYHGTEPLPELAAPRACRRVEGSAKGVVMGSIVRVFRHFDKLSAGSTGNDRAWFQINPGLPYLSNPSRLPASGQFHDFN